MTTPRRLIPAHHSVEWEAQLRKAALQALDAQLAVVDRRLGQHGLTASGKKDRHAALTTPVAPWAWDDQSWAKYVDQYVTPAAASVTAAALALGIAAMPKGSTWGLDNDGTMQAAILQRAQASGAYIGVRLNAAASGGADASDLTEGVDDVLAAAPDILGGVVGAMGIAVANWGSAAALSSASDSGALSLGETKIWTAVVDDRTREWHAEADGQEVGLNEDFDVDGEAMAYPGDPNGSDENTCNCRCILTSGAAA